MVLLEDQFKGKVNERLRIRLIIYFVIAVIILGIAIFHIATDHANLWLVIGGFLAGMLVGGVVSRMYKVSWDTQTEEVISTFDAVGIFFLILYIAFEIFRERIVEHFVDGPSVVAVSFALLAGVMYGRIIGMHGKIKNVFEEEGIV